MRVSRLALVDVLLITPERREDPRGFFSETFNRAEFESATGIAADFVQDNHSLSRSLGTVRGLHFQLPPMAQDKLVRVSKGAIYDVAVDVRRDSPTFGHWVAAVLSADNWAQLWVPKGFAHGFCTLEPETEVIYKCTAYYAASYDRGLAWNDPAIGIDWPPTAGAVLSDRDRRHPPLDELKDVFPYESALAEALQ
jgi:dTDP-4-dehydrorhamnose 3,5-epimerase